MCNAKFAHHQPLDQFASVALVVWLQLRIKERRRRRQYLLPKYVELGSQQTR